MAQMEDVLDLYEEEYDPERPVVCFDETSKQLIEESREPLGAARTDSPNDGRRAPRACLSDWPFRKTFATYK